MTPVALERIGEALAIIEGVDLTEALADGGGSAIRLLFAAEALRIAWCEHLDAQDRKARTAELIRFIKSPALGKTELATLPLTPLPPGGRGMPERREGQVRGFDS